MALIPKIDLKALQANLTRFSAGVLPVPDPARDIHKPYLSPAAPYRDYALGFADLLEARWKIDDDLILCRNNGAIMRTYRVTGPDYTHAPTDERIAFAEQMNRAGRDIIRQGVMNQWDLDQYEINEYPKRRFPDLASWLVDYERQLAFESNIFFGNDVYITIRFVPERYRNESHTHIPEIHASSTRTANAVLKEFDAAAKTFIETAKRLTFTPLGIRDHRLSTGETILVDDQITYLRMCALGDRQLVRAVAPMTDLANVVATETLEMIGPYVRIGSSMLMRPLTVESFDEQLNHRPADLLTSLGINMRVNWRMIGDDKQRTLATLKRERAKSRNNEVDLKDKLTKSDDPIQNKEAESDASGTTDLYGQVQKDYLSVGWFSQVILVREPVLATDGTTDRERMSAAIKRLDAKTGQVQGTMRNAGIIVAEEWANEQDAYRGTLPGHSADNVVKGMLGTRQLAVLIPSKFTSRGTATGPEFDYGRGVPPHFVLPAGIIPVSGNLHYKQQGGHTLVLAPTGAGKTTLLNFLVSQHRTYVIHAAKGAQQLMIDREEQAFVFVKAHGGVYNKLTADSGKLEGMRLAPIGNLDTDDGFRLSATYVGLLLKCRGMDPIENGDAVISGLDALSKRDRSQWCISGLLSVGSITENIRKALRFFAGSVIDSAYDSIGDNSLVAWDIAGLDDAPDFKLPVMTALLTAIRNRTTDGIPTLIPIEEWTLFIKDEYERNIFIDWMRTMRRRNVAIIALSQNIDDINKTTEIAALASQFATVILLPDKSLGGMSENTRKRFNIEEWRLEHLARLPIDQPDQRYAYFIRPDGQGLYSTQIGPVGVATCGAAQRTKIDEVKKMIAELGSDWYPTWIASQLPERVRERWRRLAYYGPPQPPPPLMVEPPLVSLHPNDPLAPTPSPTNGELHATR